MGALAVAGLGFGQMPQELAVAPVLLFCLSDDAFVLVGHDAEVEGAQQHGQRIVRFVWYLFFHDATSLQSRS